jgi:choline dehydrogenase-like flavoprotein
VRALFRGKLLGGCSSTNATFALRGHPADYDGWASAGNTRWSFDDVLPYFCKLETEADFGSAEWHGSNGPLPIRRYGGSERTDVALAGLETLEDCGLSSAYAFVLSRPEVRFTDGDGCLRCKDLGCPVVNIRDGSGTAGR